MSQKRKSKDEIVAEYLTGDYTYRELGVKYNIPFAPFLQSSVYKVTQLIQISFDKVTVVVLPARHQWIQQIRYHIYTTRPGR